MGGAKTAILAAGLVVLIASCGRAPVSLSPSPTPVGSPTPTTTDGPIIALPSPSKTHPPSPSARPSPTPTPRTTSRTTPSTRPSPPPLTIASLPFHPGDVSVPYALVQLAASGGTTPYSWSIVGGGAAFPPGLTLATDGSASGTPAVAGGYKFTVEVGDAHGTIVTAQASITVNPPLAVRATCATLCQVEQGCVNVCGGLGSQSGGTPPYTYTPSGALPTGTSLSALSLAGQFTAVGRWSFGVTVTDALGAAAGVKANFSVFAHIALKGGTFTGKPGVSFVVRLPYAGGTPGGTPVAALLKGSLPPGSTFVVNPKLSEVDITVPAQKLSGSYAAAMGLTDQSTCSSSSNCRVSATVGINIG